MKYYFIILVITIIYASFLQLIGSSHLLDEVMANEIAILQYDSRKPLSDYWLASAQWNKYYCDKHGHKFLYFTSKYENEDDLQWCEKDVLASPWCKVKAMVQADADYNDIKVFIYMDSDAVIDRQFEKYPLTHLLTIMKDKLQWDPLLKPLVFNQDGPCWWCRLIKTVGYSMCLNAGTVMWYRHPTSTKLLSDWWNSAMDPYEGNPIRRKFRIKWPWEQDRQMAIYNRSSEYIQVASQPDKPVMDLNAGHHDWCLSHLPESGCFISHYCAYKSSKPKLIERHMLPTAYDSGKSLEKPFGFDVIPLR